MINLDEAPLRRDFTLSARISLFALDEAHVELESDPEPEDTQFAELLLYCCMALRQLVNMVGQPSARNLEHFLRSTARRPLGILDHMNERPVTLLDAERKRAKIVFPARLFLHNRELGFTVKLAKATLFLKELLPFAASSVPALYYFLGDRRHDDKHYLKQLSLIGALSSYAFHTDQLSVQNQLPGAVSIVLGLRVGKYSDFEERLSRFWHDA